MAEQRNFISIDDQETDTTWMFDMDFINSSYECIYGRGCKSIDESSNSQNGCCSVGAHFVDADDVKTVEDKLSFLNADNWQHFALAEEIGGPIDFDGEEAQTVVHDGACIFLNREGFHAGAGCALHQVAAEQTEEPMTWKPLVCWQVPVRVEYHEDEYEHTTATVRPWRRRDWGDGGADFNWWCTESEIAYVGKSTVYESLSAELKELVGDGVYSELGKYVTKQPIKSVPVDLIRKS